MGPVAKARSARNHPAARGLPPVWLAAAPTIPISDTCSRFLLGNLERPGRVGAQRRRAFGLRPVPPLPSRQFGFNPSRLRACGAARFACLQGIGTRPIPAARSLAPLDTVEPALPNRQASAPPQWSGRGGYAGACCGRLCGCVPPSTLAGLAHHVTKDGSPTATRHRYGASTPRLKTCA